MLREMLEKFFRILESFFHMLFARRNFSIVARYSLKFTRCSLLVVKSLVTPCKKLLVAKNHSLLVAKIHSLLVAEVACCKKSLVSRCKLHSLLVEKFARYSLQKLLVAKIHSLLVAEVARCKNYFVVKNHSLLVAKFNRYLLHKFTKNSQLNLVMGDKIK